MMTKPSLKLQPDLLAAKLEEVMAISLYGVLNGYDTFIAAKLSWKKLGKEQALYFDRIRNLSKLASQAKFALPSPKHGPPPVGERPAAAKRAAAPRPQRPKARRR